jgi:TolA-binding protein
MLCREVIPRCNAVLEEFSEIMSAEQLLEVAGFAASCESTPTARRALQIVIDRFPGTSHAALAEAQQRRLPRQ